MRQTNHNGRVNAKTGKAYSRKHNDRQYDVVKAENINESLVQSNIIIHYDQHNVPTVIKGTDASRVTIDQHEHEMYETLFCKSLSAQHRRNEVARHPERNKSIDDLLDNKNTCPEETIFQIGSLEDGYPEPSILMDIFEEYQAAVIARYGSNIHFLDATLHLDEAVPHIHVRKVWTYSGKDGLDISQNKALAEMGIERPEPEESPTKWNNAKITFSEWERQLKLSLCAEHGLKIEEQPLTPGKSSLDKEEAIVLKLQARNYEYRKESEALISERAEAISSANNELDKVTKELNKVSAELVTEEMKYREITDTNIFGKPKKIEVTPQEYRSWQKSAETKESNDKRLAEIKEQECKNNLREFELMKLSSSLSGKERALDKREANIDTEVASLVKSEVEKQLPAEIISQQHLIECRNAALDERIAALEVRNKELDEFAQSLNNREANLASMSIQLADREQNINEEIKQSVAAVVKAKIEALFIRAAESFQKIFTTKHQRIFMKVFNKMPLSEEAAEELESLGYDNLDGLTVGDALHYAAAIDIQNALVKAGIDKDDIEMEHIESIYSKLTYMPFDRAVAEAAQKIAEEQTMGYYSGRGR